MTLTFDGPIWYWRGPAPFHFVTVPSDACAAIQEVARDVTYGWGMIPASVRVGATEFTTSLWPKNGGYIVPIKDRVRHAEGLEIDDRVTVTLGIAVPDGA